MCSLGMKYCAACYCAVSNLFSNNLQNLVFFNLRNNTKMHLLPLPIKDKHSYTSHYKSDCKYATNIPNDRACNRECF